MSKPSSSSIPSLTGSTSDTIYYVNQAEEVVTEAPPAPEARRVEWERILGVRPGELSPEVVAYNARQRDNYITQTLDEIFTPPGRGGGRRVGD
jgi:hypothetical protein